MKSIFGTFIALIALICGAQAQQALDINNLPPVVIRTNPVANATDVSSSVSEIRVTFSKDMKEGTWSWIKMSEDSFPELVGLPHFSSDSRTCILGVKLKPGHTYAVWLNSSSHTGFKDTEGHSAVPYLLTFSTKK